MPQAWELAGQQFDSEALRLELFHAIIKGRAPELPKTSIGGPELLQNAAEAASPHPGANKAAKNMTQMADGLDDAGVEALMQALHARTAKSGGLSIDHTGKQFVRETQ
uniref:Uncharacterized protein n=1 Tax=Dunaliella tertiolecta TaxID=3047 RepID=A0A6S8P728_DUNTE